MTKFNLSLLFSLWPFFILSFFIWGWLLNKLAYILLNSKKQRSNWLFNLITIILSGIIFSISYNILSPKQFLTSLLFFSALLVTIRTDLEHMLISEAVTIYLIPAGLILSYFNFTWTTLPLAIIGTIVGYLCLWTINKIFYLFSGKNGLGEGDMDLLAMIGSFTGLFGVWASILLGSISASIIGIIYILIKKDKEVKIPFGLFLSMGAILFVLLKEQIFNYLLK